ncbi:MAG: acylphosphatase, partial [Rariglobus sp.]
MLPRSQNATTNPLFPESKHRWQSAGKIALALTASNRIRARAEMMCRNFVALTLRIEPRFGCLITWPLPIMADVHQETVYFTGHVQGVGFRYSTLQVAKEFEVTGQVRNLADGRVQLEIEGNPREVNTFVSAVEERMHGYIRRIER